MIQIVPMTEEHIDGVLAVEEATFSIPWSRVDFEKEVRENRMAIYYVAVLDGKVVGYAGMWHVITEGHITNVAVLEETRGKGVGAMLMEKLIAIVKRYMTECAVKGYDEENKKGAIRHIVAREIGGKYIITLVSAKKELPN